MSNRDVAAMWEYHDGTKHSLRSVRENRHSLDWDIMPRPFKVYPDLEPIALPRDFTSSRQSALTALEEPGKTTGAGASIDLTALARLLYFSAGVLRHKTYPGGEIYFRAAACTGALYHIDLYLVCGPLADLPAGVYHFGPHDFALRRLRDGDHRETLIAASGREPAVAAAPAMLVLTSTFWRNAWKYQARTYRHCFWDGGTLLANLLAVAAAAEIPARVVLGFVDEACTEILDLDPEREVALGIVPLGRGAAPPPAAPPAPSLDLATLPLSSREVDYPAIRRAHVASSLSTPKKVEAWRGVLPSRSSDADAAALIPLAPETPARVESIEQVILRRGSAREFTLDPISFATLSTILRSATRGVPGDFTAPDAPLTDLYLIVNAVDGLEPGTYHYVRPADALLPLRQGSHRRHAGHLGLGQALPAQAAVDVFWLADLHRVFGRFGNRGYRAAQLEAAIEAGKTYLAAYALGAGATGLTFYDDDVTGFFSPHAAGTSVMFLMAFGNRPETKSRVGS
jgi:SagB-type dehydrogenase family enzyme